MSDKLSLGKGNPTVTVGFLIGKRKEVEVEKGSATSVKDLLAKAEIDPKGHDVRVDGENATMKTLVNPGQEVLLLKPVQGNLANLQKSGDEPQSTVTVGFLIGKKQDIAIEKGSNVSVADLLAKANIDPKGHEVRVDGDAATMKTLVKAGQEVLLLKPVQGNSVLGN
jgi:sulfur carrier protein ThiS